MFNGRTFLDQTDRIDHSQFSFPPPLPLIWSIVTMERGKNICQSSDYFRLTTCRENRIGPPTEPCGNQAAVDVDLRWRSLPRRHLSPGQARKKQPRRHSFKPTITEDLSEPICEPTCESMDPPGKSATHVSHSLQVPISDKNKTLKTDENPRTENIKPIKETKCCSEPLLHNGICTDEALIKDTNSAPQLFMDETKSCAETFNLVTRSTDELLNQNWKTKTEHSKQATKLSEETLIQVRNSLDKCLIQDTNRHVKCLIQDMNGLTVLEIKDKQSSTEFLI